MYKWITFFLIAFSSLQAAEDAEEIVVNLSTDVQLFPVYLASLSAENSGLDAAELDQLANVLRFDLSHNGMMTLIKSSAEKDQLSHKALQGDTQAQGKLKAQGAIYVITPQIIDRKCYVQILALNSHAVKKMEGLQFSGNFNEDRRKMHQMADSIYKALFDAEGIASTKILYTNKLQDPKTKKWVSEVWEADYDGANARPVTRGGNFCVTPAYVPPKPGYKSGSFFYVSYEIGQPKIYIGHLSQDKGQRFSSLKGNQLMPAISRQRDQVAFISDVTGNPDLFIQPFSPEMGTIGKPRQIYHTHLATQGTPTFHPNGKQIAFVSNKDGSPKIYVIDIPPEGAALKDIKAQLISKQNRENTAPNWSPDGKKLAYCAMTNGVRQIWIYDFEKQKEIQVTQGSGHKENPSWAPDSSHLVFNSNNELFLINLHQPEATKITSGPGVKRFPSWEAR